MYMSNEYFGFVCIYVICMEEVTNGMQASTISHNNCLGRMSVKEYLRLYIFNARTSF